MSEWKNFRIKDCGVEYNGATPSSKVSLYWDGPIAWITPADMDDFGYISAGNTNISQEGYDSCGTHMLPVGSIVISSRAPIGKIAITTAPLCTNQGCKSLVPRGINTKFLAYSLYSSKDKISLLGQGTTFMELSTKALLAFDIQVPPLSEQKKITDYLDEKTSAIDSQVSLLEQKAKKYEQLKKSLISRTVTRGLNKDARLKESGIDWIGQIPEDWEVKRLKEIGVLKLGKMLQDKPFPGGVLKPYLKSKNVGWLHAQMEEGEEMYFSEDEMKSLRLKQGDLVISEGGEVGKTFRWNNEVDECYIQNSVHKLTFNKNCDSRYYLYLSFALGQKGYYKSIVNLVSIMHLTYEKLRRLSVPLPPLSEQRAIADYLDKKTAEIDSAIANINQQIEKYKLLRRALINEVVTGQRNVN